MTQTKKIRVLIVDDQATVRQGLATFLETVDNLVLVAEAANGPEAVHFCYLFQPDVALMDLRTTGLDAVTVTRLIHEFYYGIQVIVLVSSEEEDQALIEAAIQAGAVISLHKVVSAGELAHAIEAAYANKNVQVARPRKV